jgi:hypothetical protein
VFENRVLRRIFGPKRDEVTGVWRKLHNELHNLYASPTIIRMVKSRRMRLAGYVARIEVKRNAHRIWVEKSEIKGALGRKICRWVGNIKMDHGEIKWVGMDWISLSQDRDQWKALVHTVMNLQVP